MDVIDGNWLAQRLPKQHGAKAEFAYAIGLTPDKLSKVLNGHRQLKPREIASIWRYFESEGQEPTLPEDGPRHMGFAEEATPFTPQVSDSSAVTGLYAARARNAAITHRSAIPMPGFGIEAGDLLVCDLSRLPTPGEIAIVTYTDENIGDALTLVRRFVPPSLLGAGFGAADVMSIAASDVDVRYPVIGVIRGT